MHNCANCWSLVLQQENALFRINTSTVKFRPTPPSPAVRNPLLSSLKFKRLSVDLICSQQQNRGMLRKVRPEGSGGLLAPSSDADLLLVAPGEAVRLLGQLRQNLLQSSQVVLELLLQVLVLLLLL